MAGVTSPLKINNLNPNTNYSFYLIDSYNVGGFGTPLLISATTLNSFATANYTWDVNSATSSFSAVAFDATTSTNATTYTWNIGDNSAAGTGATPTHQYVINGSWNLY